MLVVGPTSPVASLVLIGVNIDRDINIAFTFSIWIVTYRNCIIGIYLIIPIIEPLVIVSTTASIRMQPSTLKQFSIFLVI